MRHSTPSKNSIALLSPLLLATLSLSVLGGNTAHAASVSTWEKVAQCESSGNWSTDTGNGYYGGLQISKSTGDSFGGDQYAAYPNQATEDQQIMVAENILTVQGENAWPTCGPQAGLGSDHANPFPSSSSTASGPVYSGDVPLTGKWSGGTDSTIGVFRPSTSTFYLRNTNSAGAATTTISLGDPGDLPISGDWSAAGHTQVGVFRPSTNTFYLRLDDGTTTHYTLGNSGDLPITGNWDGAGGTQFGVFRATGNTNTFFMRHANGTVTSASFGNPGDKPITGDWDGTGHTQIGVFRPSTNTFYLHHADGSTTSVALGNSGDLPIAGDWNGTGKTFIGLYRPSNANFYLDETYAGGSTVNFLYGNGGTWS